jgi:hypothetical protein
MYILFTSDLQIRIVLIVVVSEESVVSFVPAPPLGGTPARNNIRLISVKCHKFELTTYD